MGRRESGWRELLSGTQTLAHIGCNFLVTHLVYKDPKPSTPMTAHPLIPLDAAPGSRGPCRSSLILTRTLKTLAGLNKASEIYRGPQCRHSAL